MLSERERERERREEKRREERREREREREKREKKCVMCLPVLLREKRCRRGSARPSWKISRHSAERRLGNVG